MRAALDARARLRSLRPWNGRPIVVHQCAALLRTCPEVWVDAVDPEILAALPRRARLGPPPPGAARYGCRRPLGAPATDLDRPDSVPRQGWLLLRRPEPDLVVFSEPLCLCPRWNTDYVHSYLLLGRDRGLLIDTGTGLGDVAARARALCPELVCVHTHGDWDHVGGSGVLPWVFAAGRPGRIPARTLLGQLARPGASPWRPDPPAGWPWPPPPIVPVPADIDLGGRVLRILPAAGHTPDSIALYDEGTGDLFAGDAVYAGLLYARDRRAFAGTRRRLRALAGLRRIWGGHGPVPVSQADVEQYGQLVE